MALPKRRSNAGLSTSTQATTTSAFHRNPMQMTGVTRRELRLARELAEAQAKAQFKVKRRSHTRSRLTKTAATLTATGGLLFTMAVPSYAVDPVTAASTNLVAKTASDDQPAESADSDQPATDAETTVAAGQKFSVADDEKADSDDLGLDRNDADAKDPVKADDNTTSAGTDADSDDSGDDSDSDSGSQNFSSSSLLSYGAKYLGVPYVWGGTTPSGFDCSGFTAWVFRKQGIHLPHSSSAQAHMGKRVSASQAKPGDLLAIPGHVGIYVGNGRIMHAPKPGSRVKVQKMWGANWKYIRL